MNEPLTYCLCSQCAQSALFQLGLCALTTQEFIQRAKLYKLSDEQKRIVDGMMLQLWNESMKGEMR